MFIRRNLRNTADSFKLVVLLILSICLVALAAFTWRWPLVNDAAYIHYVVFMLEHHYVPYRDLMDVQMPGAYAVDWLVMHSFGHGALAWRMYDFALLGIAGIAIFSICRPYGRFSGFYAASLFALFHARDGIAQLGQRDLTVAVLVLTGVASLMNKTQINSPVARLCFGICIGFASAIKPTAILFLACFHFLPEDPVHSAKRRFHETLEVILGVLIAPVCVALWLGKNHALRAFWITASTLVPLHAKLGYTGLAYLLKWSLPPSLFALSCLAIASRVTRKTPLPEKRLLLTGVLCGAASYFIQGKGFPYHRYPIYAFLFPLLTLEFVSAIRRSGFARSFGYAGLALGTITAPLCVSRALHDHWAADPEASLAADLRALTAPRGINSLNGHVQCLDSISSCATTLYDLKLVQSTGQMQDELIFASADKESPRQIKATAELRDRFLANLKKNPPKLLIVTSWLFPEGPDAYKKLQRWPEFSALLKQRFILRSEKKFPPNINGPSGYRLYLLRDH